MDARHFDALARALTEAGTRRSLLAVLATLPVVGGLLACFDADEAAGKDRRRRRKTRHKKRHKKGRGGNKHTRKCKAEAQTTTCAGKCGSVVNNCKETVDCGSCDCNPTCPECKTCQGAPGTCVLSTAGTPCGAAQSCTNGIVTAQATCDGTGTCTPGAQTSCAPYTQCTGTACATTCNSNNDCVPGSFCNAQNRCDGDLPIGDACANDEQCASGHCAQGVCCDTTCDSGCHACDLQGSKGTCTVLSDGSSCGSGAICCAGVCEEGVCCSSDTCTTDGAPACVDHDCVCPANSNSPCGNDQTCCDDGCFNFDTSSTHCGDCETSCGPGQTCQNGVCGVVCGSDFCPASSEICVSGECKTCDVTCPVGTCSGATLRDKIIDGGTIYVCPGRYTGTYRLRTAAAVVIGAGQGDDTRSSTILDAQQADRVVSATEGGTHELHNLRITGGNNALGGGVRANNETRLTMVDCTVTENNTSSPPIGVRGGGIDSFNAITILTRCTISNNKALAGDGIGGGIFQGGEAHHTLTMTDCRITQNSGVDAGGVCKLFEAVVDMTNTFVWNNTDPQCSGSITVHGTGGCGVAPPA